MIKKTKRRAHVNVVPHVKNKLKRDYATKRWFLFCTEAILFSFHRVTIVVVIDYVVIDFHEEVEEVVIYLNPEYKNE